jgi:hypothetical protein
VRELLNEAKQAGYESIRIEGEGDIADICRLTCLEQGMTLVDTECAPVLEVHGMKVHLRLEERA